MPSSRGDERARTRARSPRAARARPFSRRAADEVADERLVGSPRAAASSAAAFGALVELAGCGSAPQLRHRVDGLDEDRQLARAPRRRRPASLRRLEERPRVRAVRRQPSARSGSLAPRSRARRSPRRSAACWSVAVEHLAGHLPGGDHGQVGDLGADRRRARAAVSASICRVVSSSRRWRSSSVSSRTRLRCASATLAAPPARISSACTRAWPISLRCSSSELARLRAGPVGLVERVRGSARGARRSRPGSGRTRTASGRRARSGSRRSSRSSAQA